MFSGGFSLTSLQICFTRTSLKYVAIVVLFPGFIIHIICVLVLLLLQAELETRTRVQGVYLGSDLKNHEWGIGESEAGNRKDQYKSVFQGHCWDHWDLNCTGIVKHVQNTSKNFSRDRKLRYLSTDSHWLKAAWVLQCSVFLDCPPEWLNGLLQVWKRHENFKCEAIHVPLSSHAAVHCSCNSNQRWAEGVWGRKTKACDTTCKWALKATLQGIYPTDVKTVFGTRTLPLDVTAPKE